MSWSFRRCRQQKIYLLMAAAIAFAVPPLVGATAAVDSADLPRVAFFGFQLINTSLEPTVKSELHRVDMLDELFRERLDNSGRFKIVPIPPDHRRPRNQRMQRLRARLCQKHRCKLGRRGHRAES